MLAQLLGGKMFEGVLRNKNLHLTKRALDGWYAPRFFGFYLNFERFPFRNLVLNQPPVTQAVRCLGNSNLQEIFMNIPHTCYLIASSPRSGSQLLGELLTSTGLAGFPTEHFNPWHMGDATDFFPDDLLYGPEHIQKLIEKDTTPNGVFGTKAHFLQVVNFVGLECLENLYPTPLKYISLRRRDFTRQGISLARAVQTNSYNSVMQPVKDPIYNFHQILQCIREVRVDAKGWETYFHQRGIEPLRVNYEDFVVDQRGTLKRIFDFLEIAIPTDFQITASSLKQQSDSLSELWVEKFNRGDQE